MWFCGNHNDVWAKDGPNKPPMSYRWDIHIVYSKFYASIFNDCTLFGKIIDHIHWLVQILARCRETDLSQNAAKCAFVVSSGMMLGHIVGKDGIAIDPKMELSAIMEAPSPKNVKELGRVLDTMCWHSRVLWYLVDITTPLHIVSTRNAKKHVGTWKFYFQGHQSFNSMMGQKTSIFLSTHQI